MEDFLCIFKIGHLLYRCATHLGVAQTALMCSLSGRCGNLQSSTQTRSPISVFGEAFKVRTAEHREQVVSNSPTQYWLDISEQSFRLRIIFSLMWQKSLKHIDSHTVNNKMKNIVKVIHFLSLLWYEKKTHFSKIQTRHALHFQFLDV